MQLGRFFQQWFSQKISFRKYPKIVEVCERVWEVVKKKLGMGFDCVCNLEKCVAEIPRFWVKWEARVGHWSLGFWVIGFNKRFSDAQVLTIIRWKAWGYWYNFLLLRLLLSSIKTLCLLLKSRVGQCCKKSIVGLSLESETWERCPWNETTWRLTGEWQVRKLPRRRDRLA